LHYCVQDSMKEIAQALLDNECDPNVVDECGYTALFYAAQNGAHEVVDLLIKSYCDKDITDEDGCSALHKAVQFGHHKVVKLLLDAGCKQFCNKIGISPLDVAKYWNHTEILALLKQTMDNSKNV